MGKRVENAPKTVETKTSSLFEYPVKSIAKQTYANASKSDPL